MTRISSRAPFRERPACARSYGIVQTRFKWNQSQTKCYIFSYSVKYISRSSKPCAGVALFIVPSTAAPIAVVHLSRHWNLGNPGSSGNCLGGEVVLVGQLSAVSIFFPSPVAVAQVAALQSLALATCQKFAIFLLIIDKQINVVTRHPHEVGFQQSSFVDR